jgi:hypothetical protein
MYFDLNSSRDQHAYGGAQRDGQCLQLDSLYTSHHRYCAGEIVRGSHLFELKK